MLAWRVHKLGPPEVINLERIARPDPSPGQVLVHVHAAGVGPWDGWIRAGKSALPQPLPFTLGSDFAGTVAALGSDTSVPPPCKECGGKGTNHEELGSIRPLRATVARDGRAEHCAGAGC
jgi:NADPH:quinone reductase-like Zn-dependent oxidoreductase